MPIAMGIRIVRLTEDMAFKYAGYTPKHISKTVLLIPGTIIPIDIIKPANTRYKVEKVKLEVLFILYLFSKIVKSNPMVNVTTIGIIFFIQIILLLEAFFRSAGNVPKIKPINAKHDCILKVKKKYFKIFPNNIIPITAPKKIGTRNRRLFFKSLKRLVMLFTSFSYIPKITQKTPLLIPGIIAPAPIKIPIKKLKK